MWQSKNRDIHYLPLNQMAVGKTSRPISNRCLAYWTWFLKYVCFFIPPNNYQLSKQQAQPICWDVDVRGQDLESILNLLNSSSNTEMQNCLHITLQPYSLLAISRVINVNCHDQKSNFPLYKWIRCMRWKLCASQVIHGGSDGEFRVEISNVRVSCCTSESWPNHQIYKKAVIVLSFNISPALPQCW